MSSKIRATVKGGTCTVKALITHPMETGLRKNKKTGKKIPAHFIQKVVFSHNGNEVMNADWGGAVSTNPYVSFKLTGVKGNDKITLNWSDNKGKSESKTTKAKAK